MKSCFFIGHRDAPDSLADKLDAAIEEHISNFGVGAFVVGNYGNFDRMSQRALVRAKKRRPEIVIQMAVPYHPALVRVELPDGFDDIYFPKGQESVPRRAAISRLNRTLIDESDFLIAHVLFISGGAYGAMQYAGRRERRGLLRITRLGG
jgi:hypothetical protein